MVDRTGPCNCGGELELHRVQIRGLRGIVIMAPMDGTCPMCGVKEIRMNDHVSITQLMDILERSIAVLVEQAEENQDLIGELTAALATVQDCFMTGREITFGML